MWQTDTRWFDVAIIMGFFTVGNILFGRFEEHKHRGRRLLKPALVLAIMLALIPAVGRAWAYGVLVLPALGAAWVHIVWLPRHGINGWTAEPRDKYLELLRKHSRLHAPR